jgi:hypothetical protein
MTYDHTATTIHRAAVDHDIDTIRNERLLAGATAGAGPSLGLRGALGRLLIATGTALVGRDRAALGARRA